MSQVQSTPGVPSRDQAFGAHNSLNALDMDSFLDLMIAELQNQDPLNPLDNAQVTSQMAQINTVSGIEKLNGTVQGLNRHFVQRLNPRHQAASVAGGRALSDL